MIRAFLALLMASSATSAAAQHGPKALADSDLVVHSVAYGADSTTVRRALGAPLKAGSVVWVYRGLQVLFEGAKVVQVEVSDPSYQTARGLRVGDPVERATTLYGASCVRGHFFYCRTVGSPDDRGISLEVLGGRIVIMRVGAVLDLD